MADSLFDCLSKSYIDFTLTDKWANGLFGEIVDIKGDGNYRFVDYGMDADGKPYKVYLTEEDEMACPVVATGFVAYWLHNRNQRVKKIFEGYFTQQLQAYERAHEYDDDAWKRDLKREFVERKHLSAEHKAIRTSEAIFPYLTENDVNRIQSITGNYLRFARKKRKELYPPNYPQNKVLEETFLAPYRPYNAADECVLWLRVEYNLPERMPKKGDPTFKESLIEWYDVDLRKYIEEEHEDFQEAYLIQMSLMEEIHENLKACATHEDRLRYVTSLVQPFERFADAFNPTSRIEKNEIEIKQLEQELKKWKEMTDDVVNNQNEEPLDKQAQIVTCEKKIQERREEIEYWKQVQKHFYKFARPILYMRSEEEVKYKMCQILRFWWQQMIDFAHYLAALILTYGIKLTDVQRQCGVYLQQDFKPSDYVDNHYIVSTEHAERLLNEIENKQAKVNGDKSAKLDSTEQDQHITSEEVKRLSKQIKTGKARTKSPRQPKKDAQNPPKPLVYYTLEYINDDSTRHIRIDYVQRKLEAWGWMGSKKNTESYELLFSGKNVYCKLKWKGSAATLYRLMRELLKQPFIKKYTGCSARSIVETQFDCGLNQHANDVKAIDKSRIDKIIFLLNPEMDLPTRGKGINESIDVSDTALAKAMVRCGELHSSNRR